MYQKLLRYSAELQQEVALPSPTVSNMPLNVSSITINTLLCQCSFEGMSLTCCYILPLLYCVVGKIVFFHPQLLVDYVVWHPLRIHGVLLGMLEIGGEGGAWDMLALICAIGVEGQTCPHA